MTLHNEEKAKIKEALRTLDCVHLNCDGYLVSARYQLVSETKLGILVYVDGVFKGKWIDVQNQDEESKRFYPLHKKQLFPKNDRKLLKIKPKDNFFHYRKHYFSTANVFINHIVKNNESIAILTYERYNELLAKKKGENDDN